MRKYMCLFVLVAFMGSFCLPGFAEEPINFLKTSKKHMESRKIYQLAETNIDHSDRVERKEYSYSHKKDAWDKAFMGCGMAAIAVPVVLMVVMIAAVASAGSKAK